MTTAEIKEQYSAYLSDTQVCIINTMQLMRTFDIRISVKLYILAYHDIMAHLYANGIPIKEICNMLNITATETAIYINYHIVTGGRLKDIQKKTRLQRILEKRMSNKEVMQILKELKGTDNEI